jgi:hypothetical protein
VSDGLSLLLVGEFECKVDGLEVTEATGALLGLSVEGSSDGLEEIVSVGF